MTKFSVFDNDWHGVATRTVVDLVTLDEGVSHVMVHAAEGYEANLPLEVFADEDCLFAWERYHNQADPWQEERYSYQEQA